VSLCEAGSGLDARVPGPLRRRRRSLRRRQLRDLLPAHRALDGHDLQDEYGDPDKEADLLLRLSPIHNIDRVTAAAIVLHGANDTNVPVVEAEQVESLKKRGIPVEYALFPDEGHGWRKTANRIRSAVAVTRWFEKYLKAGG